jgi:glycosyltransferase involved in cell wall biosynthesis
VRVLYLPVNIASQLTVAVRALRDLGIEARALAPRGVITSNEWIEHLYEAPRQKSPRWVLAYVRRYSQILRAISWADVIHWACNWAMRDAADVHVARMLKKKRVVEFFGSDIRIPAVEAADNPYYARLIDVHEYQEHESLAISRARQKRFASLGAPVILSCKSLFPYIQRDLFPQVHFIRQRVYLADYTPAFPDPAISRPLIVHSPSAPVIKGTAAVKRAVEQLQPAHAFDFRLLQGVPHTQAKQIVQSCDIFVDQLVLGAHGLAALEAMAYGKPVVCYIKPSMVGQYPPDLPIVNATQETLPEVLARLIEDGAWRQQLGQRGRAYVEKYHDARVLARQLVQLYEGL